MKTIIFDFDGTLADSFEHLLDFLLGITGRPDNFSAHERNELKGLSMKDLALRVGIPPWKLPLVYFRGRVAMHKRMPITQPFQGIPEVLAALKTSGYRMYIISSNSRRNINLFLRQQQWENYFIHVYGGGGWFGKGQVLRDVCKKHKLAAQDCIYVGDEARDVIGAKLAGVPCIAVTWGFSSHEILSSHHPAFLVDTPAELLDCINATSQTK